LTVERDTRSPGNTSTRDSYLSGNSSAPSFVSGMSYDPRNEAPKIVTQIQVGRKQQAEVVQIGRSEMLAPNRQDEGFSAHEFDENPYGGLSPALGPDGRTLSPASHRTFGLAKDSEPPLRNLTSPSRRFDSPSTESYLYDSSPKLYSGPTAEPNSTGPTDLRFSMGSLAFSDGFSTKGTDRYLGKPDSGAIPLPRREFIDRQSTFSAMSGDSIFKDFPMIPPNSNRIPPLPTGLGIPQSTSVATLDGGGAVTRPPTAFKAPRIVGSEGSGTGVGGTSRPVTGVSMADSFLGSFPFVPPNMDDLAELPSAALPSAAVSEAGRRRLG
jgi:hypothetical protein